MEKQSEQLLSLQHHFPAISPPDNSGGRAGGLIPVFKTKKQLLMCCFYKV
jgi:hypothetical protein